MTGERGIVAAAALLAAVAIAAGAFAAHGIDDEQAAGWLDTGSHYLLIHAVAAVAIGRSGEHRGPAWLLLGGAALFAATLYAMAAGAPRILGAVTPIGGSAMIAGWLWFAFSVARRRGS